MMKKQSEIGEYRADRFVSAFFIKFHFYHLADRTEIFN